MLISWEWLCELVEGLDGHTPQQVAEVLTRVGFEVEELSRWEAITQALETLIIGEIVEVLPLTDNLKKVIVSTGTQHTVSISAAHNIRKGRKVPVALPGTLIVKTDKARTTRENSNTLIPVSEQTIAGVVSQCVLCSPAEAGMGFDASGVWLLPSDAPVGKKIIEWLKKTPADWIFDISVPPNRGDALSHIGIAREVAAALFGSQEVVRPPRIASTPPPTDALTIKIHDHSLCSYYLLMVCENVKLEPSPWQIQKRLLALRHSLHNNVVDISNYVMLEIGQPTHPFDAEKLGNEVHVRRAHKNEKALTLDGQERNLTGEELVIASESEVMALAGVIGCLGTAISEHTRAIALESALFNSIHVRKTARLHRLSTEASYRFERGVPPAAVDTAPLRWLALIEPSVVGNVHLCMAGNSPVHKRKVQVSLSRISALLGEQVTEKDLRRELEALGFCILSSGKSISVEAPTWRVDILREEDIAEEYARLHGYDKIGKVKTISVLLKPRDPLSLFHLRKKLITTCVSMGYTEIVSPPFVENALVDKLFAQELNKIVHLPEAINKEASYMMHTPVLALLPVLSHNQRHRKMQMQVAEITKTYCREEDKFYERWYLTLARWEGERLPRWHTPAEKVNLFNHLLEDVTFIAKIFAGIEIKWWQEVQLPNTAVAVTPAILTNHNNPCEELPPIAVYVPSAQLTAYYKLKGELACAYIDIEWLKGKQIKRKTQHQKTLLPTPLYRDISFIVRQETPLGAIVREVFQALENSIMHVSIIDIYTGTGIPERHKSITLRVWLAASSPESANTLAQHALQVICSKFEAKKRG